MSTTPQPHDVIGKQGPDGQWNIYRMQDDKSFTFLEGPYIDEQKTAERVRALCPLEVGDRMFTLGGRTDLELSQWPDPRCA